MCWACRAKRAKPRLLLARNVICFADEHDTLLSRVDAGCDTAKQKNFMAGQICGPETAQLCGPLMQSLASTTPWSAGIGEDTCSRESMV